MNAWRRWALLGALGLACGLAQAHEGEHGAAQQGHGESSHCLGGHWVLGTT